VGRKRKKRKKHARPRRAHLAERAPAELLPAPARRWMGLGLDVALAAVCLFFLVKSARIVGGARFFTDECLHTYIVEHLVESGHSPVRLTHLYSGVPNNTHPLFHWLATPFYLAGGRAALPYVNVVLCGIMLGALYWVLRAWVSAGAARIAVAVTLLFSVVHVCTQIFYVEVLSALTFMLAAVAITIALSQTDWKLYFLAGAACALALLSKQTGYILAPVVVLSGAWMLVRRRWRHAIGMAVLAAVFLGAFAVGMYALCQSPLARFRTIYVPVEAELVPRPLRLFARAGADPPPPPQLASARDPSGDLQPAGGGLSATAPKKREEFDAKKMLKETFGRTPREILGEWWAAHGWLGAALTLFCLGHLFVARRHGGIAGFGATTPMLMSLGLLLLGAVYIRTVDPRHFISAIPVLAAGTGIGLCDLLGRARRHGRVLVLAASGIGLVWAAVTVVLIPSYRTPTLRPPSEDRALTFREGQWWKWRGLGQNAPESLIEAAHAIRDFNKERWPVLSVWTSATWYYSGCPTTWAGVNVERFNSMMLEANRWRALRPYYREVVKYLLIDNLRIVPDENYRGVEYTKTFIDHVSSMIVYGAMRIVYPDPRWLEQQFLRRGVGFWGNPAVPFIVVELNWNKLFEAARQPHLPHEPGMPER